MTMSKHLNQQVVSVPSIENEASLVLPFLILTNDLIIRPLLTQDKNTVYTAVKECLKDLKMWLPWVEEKPKLEDADKICQKFYYQAERKEACHFSVYKNETFLGMCSFYETNYDAMTTHLGYWCREDKNSGEQFIDAINAILRYGFEVSGLKEVSVSCIVGNYTSELAAKKLNFKLQGIHLIKHKQIKLFKISEPFQLPALNVQWIKEATESVSKPSEPPKAKPVPKSFMDEDF
jgi:RimJ/RimL family protein N-acetyltransferase